MPLDLRLGDVVELRKPHPCGSRRWQVVRLGADIGIRCLACQRCVLLERRVLERRLKAMVSRTSLTAGADEPKMSHSAPSLEDAIES